MRYCCRVEDVNAWFRDVFAPIYPQEFDTVTTHDPKELEDDPFEIDYYLSECSPKMSAFLRDHGLALGRPWNGDLLIYFNPEWFEAIDRETTAVQLDYDSCGGELEKLGYSLGEVWKKYELHGDDDVDYNGGYLQIVIDSLRALIKHGPIPQIDTYLR